MLLPPELSESHSATTLSRPLTEALRRSLSPFPPTPIPANAS